MNKVTRLTEELKKHGYSMTKPRLVVFQYLLGKEPVSMNLICKSLSQSIDKASIYRTLNVFEELGITHRQNIGWKYKIELSDMFMEHHHHLTCTKCGKIISINEAALERSLGDLATAYEFTVTRHLVELQGFCSSCRHAVS